MDMLERFKGVWSQQKQVVVLVLYPILFMVIFGFIFPNNSNVTNQPIAVANLDGANNGIIGNVIYNGLSSINNTNGAHYFALNICDKYIRIRSIRQHQK